MKQADIEKKLTKLQDEDPTNPEIYNLLVKLIRNMLISQNWLLSPMDFDNVVHDTAADIFMKVYNRVYHVELWRALAYRMLKLTYVKKQREISFSQVFETNNDPIVKEKIYNTCASYINDSEKEFAIAENKAYLRDMRKIIKQTLDESKFDENSVEYLSIYMSVCLSLLYNRDVYFHVSDAYKPFVHILSQNVKQKFSESDFFSISRKYDILGNPDFDNALVPDLEFLGLLNH